jgi:hypothetical protein
VQLVAKEQLEQLVRKGLEDIKVLLVKLDSKDSKDQLE